MLRAVAGDPPGPDLAAVGDELPQQPRVLVVHVGDLLLAEQADLLFWLANRWLGHRGAPWQSPARGGGGRYEGGGAWGMWGVVVRAGGAGAGAWASRAGATVWRRRGARA